VIVELGLAVGLILITINTSLVYVGIGVLAAAVVLGALRWRGKWVTQWLVVTIRYLMRRTDRTAHPVQQTSEEVFEAEDETVTGPSDPRVNLLRLAVPDLVVAHSVNHDRNKVGLAWHQGSWTAVLLVEPTPSLVTPAGTAPNLPLSALEPCLEDRGVVLDSIQAIWHCYPGSAALPADSPALSSYMEVLGPLPAAARRTTWVAIRLDPKRCPAAIRERGGGVIGAHRALIGALSRVSNALEANGVPTRPLDPDELLRSSISAAELTGVAGSGETVRLQERWTGVTTGGIGHASYAISNWPKGKINSSLNTLTSLRALSSTVSLAISPAADDGRVGLRGLVRVSARTPRELDEADSRLTTLADGTGVTLTPLRGYQADAFAASLPIGGPT